MACEEVEIVDDDEVRSIANNANNPKNQGEELIGINLAKEGKEGHFVAYQLK